MKRALIIASLSLIATAIWHAFATRLPYLINALFLPPIVLVFISQYFKPFEIIGSSLLCGLFIDVLGGFPVGFNILLMLIAAIAINLMNVFSGKIYNRELIYYVFVVSLGYRLALLISQFIFFGHKTNLHVAQLFFGPIIDGLFSIPFYYGVVAVLSLVKAFDRAEFYKNRIGYGQ
jgi:hypothetical protein